MAYTNSWDNTAPLGSQAANLIDDDIRALKLDIGERLTTIFGIGTLNALDPVLPISLNLKGSATSKIIPGATSLSLRNNADSADNLIITDAGIATLRNNLGLSSSGDIAVVLNTSGSGVRYMSTQKGGQNRFAWGSDSDAESGGNVGSSFFLRRYTDAGASVDDPIRVARATGLVTIADGLVITTGGLVISAGGASITGGSTTISSTALGMVAIRFNGAAAGNPMIEINRSGSVKGYIGLNASDSFVIFDSTGANARLTIDSNGTVLVGNTVTGASVFWVDRNDAAALLGLINLRRGGASKGFLGLDASDNVAFLNIAGSAANLTITDAGGVTIRAGLTVNVTSGTSILLNSTTGAAADVNQLIFQRGGSNKWRIGNNIDGANADNLNIYSDVLATSVLSANTLGKVTIGSSSVTATVSLDIDSGLAAGNPSVRFLRAGTQRYRIGFDASDNFAVFDAAGGTVNGSILSSGVVNARVGFQIGGAAASGAFLRGNGTNFVSNTIQLSDLPGQPTARAYRTSNIDLTQNTLTAVGFDAEDFDTGTIHDNVTNNSRLTVPNDGKYLVTAHITWTGITSNVFAVIRKNGVATDLAKTSKNVTNNSLEVTEINVILSLLSTDYVEVYAQTDAVANPDIQSGIERTYFSVIRIG